MKYSGRWTLMVWVDLTHTYRGRQTEGFLIERSFHELHTFIAELMANGLTYKEATLKAVDPDSWAHSLEIKNG